MYEPNGGLTLEEIAQQDRERQEAQERQARVAKRIRDKTWGYKVPSRRVRKTH